MSSRTNSCAILDDIRVVEVGGGIAAAYCGRLLAALGAEVIKVEPPGGDELRRRGPFAPADTRREQGGLFFYLNCDKRSVTLDSESSGGRELLGRLLERADVAVVGLAPRDQERLGLSAEALRASRPDLIVTSLTAFGASGPHRDYRGYDLTMIHWGGLANITPRFNADPQQEPLRPDGYLSEFLAGLHGALATVAAILRRDATRSGGTSIDMSALEAVLYCVPLRIAGRSFGGQASTRLILSNIAPFHFFPCRDGYIFIMTVEDHQWEGLVELMGRPDWATADYLKDRQTRADTWEAIEPLIAEWARGYTVEELYRKGSALRVPCAPAATVGQFVTSQHMRARQFFTTVADPRLGEVGVPGAPVRMTGTPWRLARGAPLAGEHNAAVLGGELGLGQGRTGGAARGEGHPMAAGLPLAGFQVLDLTSAWAGPMCSMLLADMGAEVLKVESEARPDITRRLGPFAELEPGLERSGYFATLCRGKRSVAVNLGSAEGIALVKRLVPLCDAVVENFSPRVMPKLGLSYQELRRLKGDIVMLSMSGYGATGPDRDYVAYGQTLEAFTGYDRLIGYPGGPPMAVGLPISDQLGGLFGALAVVTALRHRTHSGQGQYIDLSQCETMASVMPLALMEYFLTGKTREAQGNHDDVMAPHNCYRCAGEDQWVTIAAGSEVEWRALCAATGHAEWAVDPRFATLEQRLQNQQALDALLGEWTARHGQDEIVALLQGAGVAAGPTAPGDALMDDPHLLERGFFATAPHPVVGPRILAGGFARAEPTLAAITGPAPLLGEHTEQTLGALLGLPASEMERLRGAGVAR